MQCLGDYELCHDDVLEPVRAKARMRAVRGAMASWNGASGGNPVARWLADDSFPPKPPDLAVYRYKGMLWFLVVLWGVSEVVMLSILATLRPTVLGGYVGLPIAAWAGVCVTWLIVVVTAVRVRADSLVIDNWVVRHVIPWERFAGLFVETEAGMIARLDDGTVVKSVAFGRTLTDAIKGYSHMRETLDRIRADCSSARTVHGNAHPPPDHRRSLNVPWRPLLGFLVFFEAFSWIAFAAHGG